MLSGASQNAYQLVLVDHLLASRRCRDWRMHSPDRSTCAARLSSPDIQASGSVRAQPIRHCRGAPTDRESSACRHRSQIAHATATSPVRSTTRSTDRPRAPPSGQRSALYCVKLQLSGAADCLAAINSEEGDRGMTSAVTTATRAPADNTSFVPLIDEPPGCRHLTTSRCSHFC